MHKIQSSSAPVKEQLELMLRAKYSLLYLVTHEEQRADTLVLDLARAHRKVLFQWSICSGLTKMTEQTLETTEDPDTREIPTALEAIERYDRSAIFLLKDFHAFLDDPTYIRRLRELGRTARIKDKMIIVVSPVLKLPADLEKEITVIDFPLPTYHELRELFLKIAKVVHANHQVKIELTKVQAEQMIEACLGLTLAEAENAFAKACITDKALTKEDIQLVLDEKKQIVRKSGILEYFSAEESMNELGGLELLKKWLTQRGHGFSVEAQEFGLPPPKGLLLLGVQGCGKSLAVKTISTKWRMPLLRFDMGRVFEGLVGSSEANMRKAIKTAEALAPCVLWVDELEKAMAGLSSSGTTDGGTTSRVLNTFLTWLQEKKDPVFVVATANKVDQLPPELLRKGRLDEIFFVDLPSLSEREEILTIHIQKRKRDPKQFDIHGIAKAAVQFSGAELEQVVVSALHTAFAEKRELTNEDLITSAKETVPLAVTMSENIQQLRGWAKSRARPASAFQNSSDDPT